NIATIYAIEEHDGEMFIVMEYIEGRELREIIRNLKFKIQNCLDCATQIAAGLQAAHKKGITHRDIKSANIMIAEEGQVKIMDFGLAKIRGGGQFTKVGTTLGTAAYMSPEQAQGLATDHRTDIWAFGVVLYEMLTGQLPFRGDYEQAVIYSILHEEPIFPIGVPENLKRILHKALTKDLAGRYAETAGILTDLEHARDAQSEVTKTSGHEMEPPLPSILVLPFVNLSPDKENEYFSDGMTEELIEALGKIELMRVVSRTSAFALKGQDVDIVELRNRLDLTHVLSGSVRKAEQRIRISAELIAVDSDYNLWSDKYDRKLDDIFEIQDEIAANIVQALQVVLSKKEKIALGKTRTTNVEAYDFYLRGLQFMHQWRRESIDYALQMFREATAVDPNYALAYAGMADCYTGRYQWYERSQKNLEEAEKVSRKALKLDPNLAEAHVSRGWAISLKELYSEAAKEFENAIRLNPKLFDAYYLYGRSSFTSGDAAKAVDLFEQAHAVRPEDFQSLTLLALAFSRVGDTEKATLSRERAIVSIENHLRLNPDDPRALSLGAVTLVAHGEVKRGLEWAEKAIAIDPDGPTLYNVACVFSVAGESSKAIDCIERALQFCTLHKEWLQNDPDMDPLRDEPRFKKLMAGLK
ncbi:MAG: protein kinase, partial [bacterium]